MITQRDPTPVTPDDRHAVANICAILFLVVSLFSFAGRLFTKRFAIGMFGKDDLVMAGSLVFSIGQTASVIIAGLHGLGRRWSLVSESERITFQRALYSSGLLYILSVSLAKISAVFFIGGLSHLKSRYAVEHFFNIFILLWGLATLFAATFQCSPPSVWEFSGLSCINILGLWISFAVINLCTEVLLVAWPVTVIIRLQTSWKNKVVVIFCFSARILTIGAIIAQIHYLRAIMNSSDISYDYFSMVMCDLAVIALTIASTCVPYMRPFMESLESGLIQSVDLRRRSPKVSLFSNPFSSTRKGNSGSSGARKTHVALGSMDNGAVHTNVRAKPNDWQDSESATSQSRFIKLETTFDMTSEFRGTPEHNRQPLP